MLFLSTPELIHRHRNSTSPKKKWRIEEELNKREHLIPHVSVTELGDGRVSMCHPPFHDWHPRWTWTRR